MRPRRIAHLKGGLDPDRLDVLVLLIQSRVRRAVESGAEIIVIDGVNGYLNAMPDEQLLMLHLHELVAYLSGSNFTTSLLVNLPGALPLAGEGGLDVSYLADIATTNIKAKCTAHCRYSSTAGHLCSVRYASSR